MLDSDSDSDYSTVSLSPTHTPLSLVPSTVTSHLSNPRSFLSPSHITYQHCINALRDTLNVGLSLHPNNDTRFLPQLYTEGFDQEQIWQQLELWNVPIFQNLSSDVQQLLTADIQMLQENGENISVTGSSDHSQIGNEDLEQTNYSNNEDAQTESDSIEPGIDDNPEDSNLMEEFLQQEEKSYSGEEGSVQSSEGESAEVPDQDISGAAGLKYKDFFQDKKVDKPSNKSNYTLEKEKLQSRIEELERDNMAEKRWEMSGEVSSKSRPDNSLLEGYMKHQTNPGVPRITEEATEELEDLIRRRARDELWDDPVRRERPQEKRYNYSVPKQVDTQKSQLGLAEVYEQEFLKQTGPATVLRTEQQTMEDEIKVMMKEVFAKLDALSNFRYTPKPFKYEPIVIKNVPAVSVEEVIPTAMSSSDRLAPEEIAAPSRAVVSEIERTREDRKRQRRHKKKSMSHKMVLRAQNIVNKTKPGMGNSYSKRKLLDVLTEAKHMQGDREQLIHDERARKRDNSFKSSRTFFSKLEKEAKNDIERKSDKKRVKSKLSAAAIKL